MDLSDNTLDLLAALLALEPETGRRVVLEMLDTMRDAEASPAHRMTVVR